MSAGRIKKICFVHYGIGWRDGINIVLENLVRELKKSNPSLKIFLLGGEIKRKVVSGVTYKSLPELLPKRDSRTKSQVKKESLLLAKKLAQKTRGMDVVIIENPFLGGYHLPAMLGYSYYAKEYKPKTTKLFFRIHDYFRDSEKYLSKIKEFFSEKEIKKIINNKKIEGFFIVNQDLKKKLVRDRISEKKIIYLPNGIEKKPFFETLTKNQEELLRMKLNIPLKSKILLFPVRVVPRKNIEEAILLTCLLREKTGKDYILVISGRIDKNDLQGIAYYKKLKKLTAKINFPVIFTKGILPPEREYDSFGKISQFSIADLYRISEAIVSTSLREGFGYFFLECWFAKRIIIGRRLSEVIDDFEKQGLDFSFLYSHFYFAKNKDFAQIKNEIKFKRVEEIKSILEDKKKLEKVFELNKISLMKIIKILQDKKLRSKIIKKNLEKSQKSYEISNISRRFLNIILDK